MKRLIATIVLSLGMPCTITSADFIGPLPYLSQADSPFDLSAPGAYLEDFEDGLLNTPGVAASVGSVMGPSSNTDSVDGDDGSIPARPIL